MISINKEYCDFRPPLCYLSLMSDLFGNDPGAGAGSGKKEAKTLEQLKNLDGKIVEAIVKIKSLKEEKTALESRVKELEGALAEKDDEIRTLSSEKQEIKDQIGTLLGELDSIEA